MSQNTVLLHNRYRVRSILGTGGFSTIYLAVDETTGTEVSIKEFTAEHMDGLATVLRVNAYDIANRSEPQPVPVQQRPRSSGLLWHFSGKQHLLSRQGIPRRYDL